MKAHNERTQFSLYWQSLEDSTNESPELLRAFEYAAWNAWKTRASMDAQAQQEPRADMTFNEWWKQSKPAECDELKIYFREAWQLSKAAEREACAKVCAKVLEKVCMDYANRLAGMSHHDHPPADEAAADCADEIRMRSTAPAGGDHHE